MNNVDVAEAMIEVCRRVLTKIPQDRPITWESLLTALQAYIVDEQHEIEKLRKLKDKPFG